MAKSRKEYKISDFPRNKDGSVNGRFHDLTGQKFGKLTVVSFWGKGESKTKGKQSYWNCICDCGETCITQSANLKNGRAISCGCHRKENASKLNLSHGLSRHPLYPIWERMNSRCNNPNSKDFKWYGAKGIKVCDEWNASNPDGLKNFLNHLEKEMPIPSYEKHPSGMAFWTLDRINPYGDYEPSNIQWATMKEQGNNRKWNWNNKPQT